MFKRLVELGRVVFIANGPYAGKLAVIVNVVDGSRVLVDGPCSGVPRTLLNFKDIQLTKLKLPLVLVNQRSGKVKAAWEKEGFSKKWAETRWAKQLAAKKLRRSMNDFDRFKLFKAKQARNRIVRIEMAKLKKAAK